MWSDIAKCSSLVVFRKELGINARFEAFQKHHSTVSKNQAEISDYSALLKPFM